MDIETYTAVIGAIPHGKENAVSRSTLVSILDMNDREIRKAIEIARDNGQLICNDGDGCGYYHAGNIDDVERQYRTDRAKALAILKRQKKARQLLKAAGRNV